MIGRRRIVLADTLPLALVGAGLALLTLWAASRYGVGALLLPAVALGGLAIVARPELALAGWLGIILIVEDDPDGFLGAGARLYEPLSVPATVPELLLAPIVAGVLLRCLRRREVPVLPPGLGAASLLVVAAAAFGYIMGVSAGAPGYSTQGDLLSIVEMMALLVCVATVVDDERRLRQALVFLLGIVMVKGVLGTASVLAGAGRPEGDTTLSYYEPTANWVLMTFLLTVLSGWFVAPLSQQRGPRRFTWPAWVWLAFPFAVSALLLSQRRSFWIATLVGVALIIVAAVGLRGRWLILPALALAFGGAYVVVANVVPDRLSGPILERAETIDLQRIQSNKQDRYRLDERANVIREIREHPITGLGLGVPWRAERPLSRDEAGVRDYVHVAVLWWWLKFGLLGALAYVALLLSGMRLGLQIFARAASPRLAAIGFGTFASLVALAVCETTGTFTGADGRFTYVIGAHLGLLGALARIARRDARSQGLPGSEPAPSGLAPDEAAQLRAVQPA